VADAEPCQSTRTTRSTNSWSSTASASIRSVSIMDRRWCAVSGCSRAEQRRRYDQRRRKVLPLNGIRLLELGYTMFAHDRRKRLLRNAALDERIIRSRLDALLSD